MSCFCTVPADVARNRFSAAVVPILPAIPLQLKLAAALPALEPRERLDMRIDSGFDPVRLPTISTGGGPLFSMAMSLNMAMGTFTLDDLPKLDFEMQQAANSFHRNIWPRLSFLTTFKMQPLLNYAIAARLVLDLRDLGLDPLKMTPADIPMQNFGKDHFIFRVHPLKLTMLKLLLGLPPLFKLNDALEVPPLGDPESQPALRSKLQNLSTLSPPSLQIPFPLILKLAMVLESLATIKEAFGPQAMSPQYRSQIMAQFRLFARLNLPIPMPALALNAKLKMLPPMDDIHMAETMAGHSGMGLSSFFTPPKLRISPFLNVMVALHLAMNMALDLETWDQCSTCNCS